MKFAHLPLIGVLLLPGVASAYTSNSSLKTATSDGSLADTQNALNFIAGLKQDGWVLTVGVANGSYTWSSSLSVPGANAITVLGAGTSSTRPTINISYSGYALVTLNVVDGKLLRFSNLNFVDAGGPANVIGVWGYGTNTFRIDNCKFNSINHCAIRILEANASANGGHLGPYGVIDHNTFAGNGAFNGVYVFQASDSPSWIAPMSWGSAGAVYVEDNLFTNWNNTADYDGTPAVDGGYGARTVIRHNTIINFSIVGHDVCTDTKAALQYEVLHNTIVCNRGGTDFIYYLRGGTAYIWDNTVTLGTGADLNQVWKMAYYAACSGMGCSFTDSTYPGTEQPGRGTVNGAEGTVPVYIYANKVPSTGYGEVTHGICNQDASMIQLGRDYFLTAMPNYVEYTYPHPLTSAGGTTPTRPPVVIATAAPTSGVAPLPAVFDASATYDPQGLGLTYLWTFGDGTTGRTPKWTNIYSKAGQYPVQLNVSDGLTNSVTNFTINVTSTLVPPLNLHVVSAAP